jgi:hypothetical protein
VREVVFSAVVDQEARLVIDNAAGWRAMLAKLKGQRLSVTLSRVFSRRSNAQNKWYWGCIIPILSDWTGYEKDEMHEALKRLFLTEERELPSGVAIQFVPSTASLDTKAFSDYADRCCRWASEQGVPIPKPGDSMEVYL